MSKKCLAVFFLLTVIFNFNAFAKTESSESVFKNKYASSPYMNERFVLNALRQVQIAQMTYRETVGAGNFGTFSALRQANLIDAPLSTLQKYGYSFFVNVASASSSTSSNYSVIAVPQRYIKTGRKSFYIDESCVIRGADKNGAFANINDPAIETCSPSVISVNEAKTILKMRTIHSAQMTYQSTIGNGQFGFLSALFNAGLINTSQAANFYWGYYSVLTITSSTAANPALFTYQTRPEEYSRTGVRSFYIDQTGVIRGADKNGLYANQNDPPIEDELIEQENSQGLSKTYNLSAQSDFVLRKISY